MDQLHGIGSSLLASAKDNIETIVAAEGPAPGQLLSSFSNALTEFTENQIAPFIAGAAIGIDAFGKQTLGAALAEAGKVVQEKTKRLKSADVVGELKEAAKTVGDTVMENAGPKLKEAGLYVKDNPGTTAVVALNVVTFFSPGVVSGPVLWVFGWAGGGVRAGSAAAAIHASAGNVAAGSVFSTLQSAAMGGRGLAAVNGVVQGGAAMFGGLGAWFGVGNQTLT